MALKLEWPLKKPRGEKKKKKKKKKKKQVSQTFFFSFEKLQ